MENPSDITPDFMQSAKGLTILCQEGGGFY